MARTIARIVLPADVSLLLLLPGKLVAGPPERVSGRTVLDKVEDGLRQYRRENNDDKRARLVRRIAGIEEPWVDVVLGEALSDRAYPVKRDAARQLIQRHYIVLDLSDEKAISMARWEWKLHEDVLRRRARQLSP